MCVWEIFKLDFCECTLYVTADRTWYTMIVQHSRPFKVLFPMCSGRTVPQKSKWKLHRSYKHDYSSVVSKSSSQLQMIQQYLTKHILEIWYLAVRLASNRKTNKSLQNTPLYSPILNMMEAFKNRHFFVNKQFYVNYALCKN